VAQEELFKLLTLGRVAGGALGRTALVAGSRVQPALKQRCRRLGIALIDVTELPALAERASRIIGL
jgi:hypothetical protein